MTLPASPRVGDLDTGDMDEPLFEKKCEESKENKDDEKYAVFVERDEEGKFLRFVERQDAVECSPARREDTGETGYPLSGEVSAQKDEITSLTKTVDELHSKLQQIEDERCMYKDMAHSMKGNVRAFCRILPMDIDEDQIFLKMMSKSQLQVSQHLLSKVEERKSMSSVPDQRPTQSAENFKKSKPNHTMRSTWAQTPRCTLPQTNSCPAGTFPKRANPKVFFFDHIFGQNATDKDVHEAVMEEIMTAWDGIGVTILAYGATGTGKTHTINGIAETAISEFDRRTELAKKSGDEVDLSVSVLEVYNDQIRDLLGDPRQGLKIVGSEKPRVLGAKELAVNTDTVGKDLHQALNLGRKNRSTSVTNVHQHSSRSHLLLTLNVSVKSCGQKDVVKHGKLVLVDLAGSERLKRSAAEGDRLVETRHINKSLSALGDVIWAYERKIGFVPFRNSKVTHLLQNTLGLPESRTVVIVTCSPTILHMNETLTSLQFGAKVNSITIPSKCPVSASSAEHNVLKSEAQEERKQREKLEAEVEELKLLLDKERRNSIQSNPPPAPATRSSGSRGTTPRAGNERSSSASRMLAHPTGRNSGNGTPSARNSLNGSTLPPGMKVRAKSVERTSVSATESHEREKNLILHKKLAAANAKISKLQHELSVKASALTAANRELDILRGNCRSREANGKEWTPILSSRRSAADVQVETARREVTKTPRSHPQTGPPRYTYRPTLRKSNSGSQAHDVIKGDAGPPHKRNADGCVRPDSDRKAKKGVPQQAEQEPRECIRQYEDEEGSAESSQLLHDINSPENGQPYVNLPDGADGRISVESFQPCGDSGTLCPEVQANVTESNLTQRVLQNNGTLSPEGVVPNKERNTPEGVQPYEERNTQEKIPPNEEAKTPEGTQPYDERKTLDDGPPYEEGSTQEEIPLYEETNTPTGFEAKGYTPQGTNSPDGVSLCEETNVREGVDPYTERHTPEGAPLEEDVRKTPESVQPHENRTLPQSVEWSDRNILGVEAHVGFPAATAHTYGGEAFSAGFSQTHEDPERQAAMRALMRAELAADAHARAHASIQPYRDNQVDVVEGRQVYSGEYLAAETQVYEEDGVAVIGRPVYPCDELYADTRRPVYPGEHLRVDTGRPVYRSEHLCVDNGRQVYGVRELHEDTGRQTAEGDPLHYLTGLQTTEGDPLHYYTARQTAEGDPLHYYTARQADGGDPRQHDALRQSAGGDPLYYFSGRQAGGIDPLHYYTESPAGGGDAHHYYTESPSGGDYAHHYYAGRALDGSRCDAKPTSERKEIPLLTLPTPQYMENAVNFTSSMDSARTQISPMKQDSPVRMLQDLSPSASSERKLGAPSTAIPYGETEVVDVRDILRGEYSAVVDVHRDEYAPRRPVQVRSDSGSLRTRQEPDGNTSSYPVHRPPSELSPCTPLNSDGLRASLLTPTTPDSGDCEFVPITPVYGGKSSSSRDVPHTVPPLSIESESDAELTEQTPAAQRCGSKFVVEEISRNDIQRMVGKEMRETPKGFSRVSPTLLLRPRDPSLGEYDLLGPRHSVSDISLSSTGSDIKERLGKILPVRKNDAKPVSPAPKRRTSAKKQPVPRRGSNGSESGKRTPRTYTSVVKQTVTSPRQWR